MTLNSNSNGMDTMNSPVEVVPYMFVYAVAYCEHFKSQNVFIGVNCFIIK